MMSSKKKISNESNSFFGLLLLFLSLCCDGICGMQQDVVVPRFKPSPLRLQQMLNIYGILVSFITSIFLKELIPGISFLVENRICLWVFLVSFFILIYSMLFNLVSVLPLVKCSFYILYDISLHLFYLLLQQHVNSLVFYSLFFLWVIQLINIKYSLFYFISCSGLVFSLCSSVSSSIVFRKTKRNLMVVRFVL